MSTEGSFESLYIRFGLDPANNLSFDLDDLIFEEGSLDGQLSDSLLPSTGDLYRKYIEEFSQSQFKYKDPKSILLIGLYIPVFLVALFGNALIVLVVARHRRMRNITNFFIVTLAISDLTGTSVCLLPYQSVISKCMSACLLHWQSVISQVCLFVCYFAWIEANFFQTEIDNFDMFYSLNAPIFFTPASIYCSGAAIKIGDWPSQTGNPLSVKNDSSLKTY